MAEDHGKKLCHSQLRRRPFGKGENQIAPLQGDKNKEKTGLTKWRSVFKEEFNLPLFRRGEALVSQPRILRKFTKLVKEQPQSGPGS